MPAPVNAPQIFVMVDDSEAVGTEALETKILQQFHHHGFAPMVDSTHWRDYGWYVKNFAPGTNHYRFFTGSYGTRLVQFKTEDLGEPGDGGMRFTPDFILCFLETDEISDEDWRAVYSWLGAEILAIPHGDPASIEAGRLFLNQPTIAPLVLASPAVTEEESRPSGKSTQDHYGFRYFHLEPRDIMVYEVVKPHTDLPYTTLTTEYSARGHLPFFSSLFINTTWGVCNTDIAFLRQVWSYLCMEGECDLERLFKDRVEACFPSPTRVPEQEPMVWRRSLEEIVERYSSGVVNRGGKRARNEEALQII